MSRPCGVTFFMYFRALYRHNKLLCIVITLFALAQLVNNIRQDIAISPIYSYGMYSEVITPRQEYRVPEIVVNNKLLRTQDFTPYQWENIALPLVMYDEQKTWNPDLWNADIKRLLPFADSTHFVNHITEVQFNSWYFRHLANRLHLPGCNVAFSFNTYTSDGSGLLHKKH